MKIITVCRKRIRRVAQQLGGKSHLVYLGAATVLDTSIIIRVCTGGCLVFCMIVEFVKDEDEGRQV